MPVFSLVRASGRHHHLQKAGVLGIVAVLSARRTDCSTGHVGQHRRVGCRGVFGTFLTKPGGNAMGHVGNLLRYCKSRTRGLTPDATRNGRGPQDA